VTRFGSTFTFTPEFGCNKNEKNLIPYINKNPINDLISDTRPQIDGRTDERTDEHCLHIRSSFLRKEIPTMQMPSQNIPIRRELATDAS
jgi:hypothetical protein